LSLMPAEEAERVQVAFQKIADKANPIVSKKCIYLHKDGLHIVLETSGVPVFDAIDHVIGYRGVDRNVTQRIQQEKELESLRNYLANIIDSMPSMLIGVDQEGRASVGSSQRCGISNPRSARLLETP
jgi:PAS domain-containing protein